MRVLKLFLVWKKYLRHSGAVRVRFIVVIVTLFQVFSKIFIKIKLFFYEQAGCEFYDRGRW